MEQEGTWNLEQPTYLVVINFDRRQLEISSNTISTNLLIILSFNEIESLMWIKENIIRETKENRQEFPQENKIQTGIHAS